MNPPPPEILPFGCAAGLEFPTQNAETHACRSVSVPCFCPILTKIGMYRKILVKLSNTKFYENPLIGSRIVTCGHMDSHKRMVKKLKTFLQRA
jgi:hypothetical protein